MDAEMRWRHAAVLAVAPLEAMNAVGLDTFGFAPSLKEGIVAGVSAVRAVVTENVETTASRVEKVLIQWERAVSRREHLARKLRDDHVDDALQREVADSLARMVSDVRRACAASGGTVG